MQTDTILNGILAILVAERDGDERSTADVLAGAGLTGEHIATLTAARSDEAPVAAFGHMTRTVSRQAVR
jgi:hypothetical protein